MWKMLGIFAAAALIVAIEVPALIRKGYKKELWVFSILLIIGVGLSVALGLRVKLPNPSDWLTAVYRPVSNAIENLLE